MKILNTIFAFILIAVFSACSDGGSSTNIISVDDDTIVIDGNTLPTATALEFKVLRDSVDNNITLSGLDADGDTISFTVVTQPRAGKITGSGTEFSYTPDKTFFGYDSFTYTVSDGTDTSAEQTANIYVRDPAFVTLWNTADLIDNKMFLTTSGFEGNYTIDWGDGTIDYNVIADVNHTYSQGTANYVVRITGDCPAIMPLEDPSKLYNAHSSWVAVLNWGDIKWKSMKLMFSLTPVVLAANDVPDLSQVEDMTGMFFGSQISQADIGHWDTSNVTNMTSMFQGTVNLDSSNFRDWNTTNVTSRGNFLLESGSNNIAPLWETEGVYHEAPFVTKDASYKVIHLNSKIGINTAGIIDITYGSNSEPYSVDWGDGSVDTNITGYLSHDFGKGNYLITVTGNIDAGVLGDIACVLNWGNSKWLTMYRHFERSRSKLYAVDTPDLSNVITMEDMFSLNVDSLIGSYLGHWDVSHVEDFTYTFGASTLFNQDLSKWDTSSAKKMNIMFENASSFNQDLSDWDVSKVTNHADFIDINNPSIEPNWVY